MATCTRKVSRLARSRHILSDEFQNTQVEKLGFIPVSKMKK